MFLRFTRSLCHGSSFCHRIYDAQKIVGKTKSKCVMLNSLVKDEWWFHFSEIFNGKAAILNSYFMSDMTSDASRSGFAVFTNFDWAAGVWSNDINLDTPCQHIVQPPCFNEFDSSNINVLELWPILVGLQGWCNMFRNYSQAVG